MSQAVQARPEGDAPGSAAGTDVRAWALLLLRPVGVFAASRVAVGAAMWLVLQMSPHLPTDHVVRSWDGSYYFEIIAGGYAESPEHEEIYAFFPVFPLLARLLSAATGLGAMRSGLLVGTAASVAAAVTIWLLFRRVRDEATADRAVALFAFAPGSFVLSMLYAEGVMLALSAACLWALVERRWLLAGVLAAVGTASRPNALALVAACGWACAVALWQHREWRSLAAPLLAPAGFVAFHLMLWSVTGEPLTWFRLQREVWHERVSPLATVDDLTVFADDPFGNTNTTAAVLGVVVVLVGLALMARARLPGVLVVYTLAVVGLAAASETLGLRPRFVLTAFPLFLAFAVHLRGAAFSAVLGLSAVLLGAFTVVSLSTVLFTP